VVVVGAGLEVVGLEVVALGLDDAGAPGCTEDPASKTDPLAATQEWRSPPTPRSESAILGNFYQCNPVSADLVVADSGNWLLHGIVTDGQKLAGMVGNKYAQVGLGVPTPVRWRCCSTSPLTCQHRPGFADVTYYTAPSGAGVFSAGTQWWICGVDPGCTKPGVDAPAVVRTISAITTRLLDAYAHGPRRRAASGGGQPATAPHPRCQRPDTRCAAQRSRTQLNPKRTLIPYRCSRLPRCSCRALFSVAYIAERDRPLMSISCAALYSPDS